MIIEPLRVCLIASTVAYCLEQVRDETREPTTAIRTMIPPSSGDVHRGWHRISRQQECELKLSGFAAQAGDPVGSGAAEAADAFGLPPPCAVGDDAAHRPVWVADPTGRGDDDQHGACGQRRAVARRAAIQVPYRLPPSRSVHPASPLWPTGTTVFRQRRCGGTWPTAVPDRWRRRYRGPPATTTAPITFRCHSAVSRPS